jgi:hypothetical protein
VFAAALVLAAGLSVPAATAARHMLVGIQDDAMTLYGNPSTTYPLLRRLRTQIVRINLYWGGAHGVASRRPARPQDPADPAYDWTLYDRAVRYAAQNGMQVLFSIFGTPEWANGGKARNVAPTNAADLQKFAYAAASRYSGSYLPSESEDLKYLPAVKYWLAWNEPNNPVWLTPQVSRGVIVSARAYAKICTAVWQGVHFTNFRAEKVGCGATGPRGNNQGRSSRPSVSPLVFMRAVRRAGLRNFDAWAHHPYYGKPSETPLSKPRDRSAVQLGNMGSLVSQLDRLWKGKKRVWITEYGWQTAPDRQFGVSFTRQKLYLSQSFAIARANARIDMMVWFMLRDDTNLPIGWQSGLLTRTGKKKPAFTAFARLRH